LGTNLKKAHQWIIGFLFHIILETRKSLTETRKVEPVISARDQGSILEFTLDLEPLQGDGQGEGTAVQMVIPPGGHLRIVAHAHPLGLGRYSSPQSSWDAFVNPFCSPPRPYAGFGFRRQHQFFQTTGRNRINRMMRSGQPNPFSLRRLHTHPRQLISQLHSVIHPAKGSSRVPPGWSN